MGRLDLGSLRSARTARTYPVEPEELLAVVRRTLERLPRWTLGGSREDELHAVCESRLFRFKDDVRIQLTHRRGCPGAPPHGTWAEFESASRVGLWDLGQNKRNLRKLLGAVDQELDTKAKQPASPEGAPNRQTRPRRSSSSAWFATSVCQTEL